MGEFTFSGDFVIYLLGLASMWGGLMVRIKQLEKKMDKHNRVLERLAVAENRLDKIEEKQEGA